MTWARSIGRPIAAVAVIVVAVIAVVITGQLASVVRGQEPPAQPIQFQRITVPAARVGDIATELIPIDREKFKQRIADINNKHQALYGPVQTCLVQAFYTAELRNDQLVQGTAELTITHPHADPGYVVLKPFGLAAEGFLWPESPQAPAEVGLLSSNDMGVRVPRSGILAFEWSLRGARDKQNQLDFPFAFPAATSSQLELKLPEELQPMCDGAVIRHVENPSTQAESAEAEPTQRWRIEFGSPQATTLRIVSRFPERADQQPLILVRPQHNYRLATAGLEVQSTFRIDVHHQPAKQLKLHVAPELRIASIQMGTESVSFTPLDDTGSGQRELTLDLPQPIFGVNRELIVTAFASIVINQPWTLPTLRLLDVIPRQGVATLDVVAPLQLTRSRSVGCSLRSAEPLAAPLSGESRQFDMFQSDASCEIVLNRQRPRMFARTGTSLALNESLVTAQFVAELSSQGGDLFAFQLRRGVGWIVDSIETLPPAIETIEVLPSTRGLSREVRLAKPVTSDQPLKLLVKAHRRTPEPAVLLGLDMRPIELLQVTSLSSLVAVGAEVPLQLEMSDDATLTRVTNLSTTDRQLVDVDSSQLLFRDGPEADHLRVALRSQPPRYSGSIAVDATAEGSTLKQTFVFRGEPISSRVASFRVRFSQGITGSIQWSESGEIAGNPVANRLDEAGQEWEIMLRRPRSTPFEVRATTSRDLAETNAVTLAALPDAETQGGTILVGTSDATPFTLQHAGLRAIPTAVADDSSQTKVRAAFRYSPAQDVLLQLTRETSPAAGVSSWVWHGQVVSRLDHNGDVTHEMSLRLENVGAPTLSIELPSGQECKRVEIDGVPLDWPRGRTRMNLPLPAKQRFPHVRLVSIEPGKPLGIATKLRSPLPTLDVPCLDWHWSVWLPPGYASAHPPSSPAAAGARDLDWEERLLGFPLIRRSGRPWNMFDLERWSTALRDFTPAKRGSELSREFLRGLEDSWNAVKRAPETPATWRNVLDTYDTEQPFNGDNAKLWIDAVALREAGLSPESVIPNTLRGAISLLRQNHLLLVVLDDRLVLTTGVAQARGDYGHCVSVSELVMLGQTPQSWTPRNHAISLDIAATESDSRWEDRLLPVNRWLESSAIPATPWSSRSTDWSVTPLIGWTNVELEVTSSSPPLVTIYREATLATLGWATLFVAVATGWWIGQRRMFFLWLLICFSVVVTFFVPLVMLPITRSIWLGWLTSAMLLGLRRPPEPIARLVEEDGSLSFRLVRGNGAAAFTVGLVAIILSSLARRDVAAQDNLRETKAPPPQAFRVYDAVDDNGHPAGRHFHIPRPFFELLERLEASFLSQRSAWLVNSANYSVTFPETPTAGLLPMVVAEYEITTLALGATTVGLPLRQDEVQVTEASLNDQRVYPRWSESGDQLEIDMAMPNRYTLRLVLRPTLAVRAGSNGFQFQIPRVANSKLQVTGRDVSLLDLVTSTGAIQRDPMTLSAQLGPIDRLELRWPVAGLTNPAPPVFTTSQLVWLRVEPQTLVLDTQLAFTVLGGTLREVELLVDARLQYLASPGGRVSSHVDVPEGTSRRIRLQLDRAYEANEVVTISPSFVLPGIHDGKSVERPLLQLATGPISRPLVAISHSAGMVSQLLTADKLPEVPVQEFATAWGSMQLPARAFQLPDSDANWSLVIQSQLPVVSSTEELEVLVGRHRAELAHYSLFQVTEAPVWELEIATPKEMQVTSVSVIQDDVEMVRGWASNSQGSTRVFLTGPVTGQLRLASRGTLSIPQRGPFTLGEVRLLEAHTTRRTIRVYRKPEVLVELLQHEAWTFDPVTDNRSLDFAQQRLVTLLHWADNEGNSPGDVTLDVSPNAARFSGDLVTRLVSTDTGWMVEADLSLRTSAGLLDALRFRLPREIATSLKLEPAFPYDLQTVPGQSDLTLTITPPEAISNSFRIRLQAQLAASADASISAPQIEVLDSSQVERYLTLPKLSGQQAIEWDIRGLDTPDSDEGQMTYRIRGSRMRAVVREVEQPTGIPQVLLADTRVTAQTDGQYFGSVSFDLEPGGLTTCTLATSAELHLLHVTVSGLPAIVTRQDDTHHTLELGAEQLPQRVEVLFTGQAIQHSGSSQRLVFTTPSLLGLEPLTTLWSVHTPDGSRPLSPVLSHAVVDARTLEKLRNDNLQQILRYNIGMAPQHRSQDLELWRAQWQSRLTRLDPAGLWQPETAREGRWIYCQFAGTAPTLTVLPTRPDHTREVWQAMTAAAILALGWMAGHMGRWEIVRDGLKRWPHLIGVAGGLAWWLWLTPSFLGWLIIMACLASAVRPVWRGKPLRAVR